MQGKHCFAENTEAPPPVSGDGGRHGFVGGDAKPDWIAHKVYQNGKELMFVKENKQELVVHCVFLVKGKGKDVSQLIRESMRSFVEKRLNKKEEN